MAGFRTDRVAEQIKKEASDVILNHIKDPRIYGFITVTKVKVSKDLRYARVYVSIYSNDKEKNEIFEGLKNAEGYLRREIGQRVRLKFTPEIFLELDDSIEYSAKIARKLKEFGISEEEPHNDELQTTD
jgi:ribosome-binding factor A